MRKIVITLLCIVASVPALAETLYVKDIVYITMRSGPGSQYTPLKTLQSGAILNKLEVSDDEKYIKVSTKDGLEGWLPSQYLVDAPIASLLLEKAESNLATLKNLNGRLKTELDDTKKELSALKSEHQTLQAAHSKLDKENERIKKVSKEPLAMAEENDALRSQNVSMEKELLRLKQEVQVLEDRGQREWFMIGAGVMGLGVALGLILPFFGRRKKRDGWGSI